MRANWESFFWTIVSFFGAVFYIVFCMTLALLVLALLLSWLLSDKLRQPKHQTQLNHLQFALLSAAYSAALRCGHFAQATIFQRHLWW